MALVWAYLVGEHKDINIKPIRILKHGRKAKSLVKYGLEEISTILMRPTYTPKFDVYGDTILRVVESVNPAQLRASLDCCRGHIIESLCGNQVIH